MSSERARRYQEKLHRDFTANAQRNERNAEKYCAAWWAYVRGERATAPTAAEFEINEQIAAAVARQCEAQLKGGTK